MECRNIPQSAIDLIKEFEGFSAKAYPCPAGVLTIGYGHTGPDVIPEMIISKERAEELLELDVRKVADDVLELVKVPLNDSQFSALISFTYNLGIGALRKSTLLNKVNRGLYGNIPAEIVKWCHAGGKKLPGLVRRRNEEAALWSKE